MLGNDVLMARALRWAVDKHNLTIDMRKINENNQLQRR